MSKRNFDKYCILRLCAIWNFDHRNLGLVLIPSSNCFSGKKNGMPRCEQNQAYHNAFEHFKHSDYRADGIWIFFFFRLYEIYKLLFFICFIGFKFFNNGFFRCFCYKAYYNDEDQADDKSNNQ